MGSGRCWAVTDRFHGHVCEPFVPECHTSPRHGDTFASLYFGQQSHLWFERLVYMAPGINCLGLGCRGADRIEADQRLMGSYKPATCKDGQPNLI